MKENDKRLECSEMKRRAIREAKLKTKLRRSSQVVKTFECKIKMSKLTSTQKEDFAKLFLEAKWFYNHVLSIKNDEHCSLSEIKTTDIKSVIHLDKDKNKIESELEHLSSQQKQAFVARMISNETTIATLVKNGYQKYGGLKFKSEVNCIPLKQYKNSYVFKSQSKVRISGISGKIHINGTKQFWDKAEIANANLVKKPNGYFLYVTTYFNKEDLMQPKKNNKIIGLDFGCTTNITASNGTKTNIQLEESGRLKRLQKKFSKKHEWSNRKMKVLDLIKREYQKMLSKKQDKANKFVHQMKTYSKVIIQDEQLAHWQKDGHGKKVQHSCMGSIKAKLKMLQDCVVLDKWIPTTKLCQCGYVNHDIDEKDRIITCPRCGQTYDRDINAAQNMVKIYQQVLKNNSVPKDIREVKLEDFEASTIVAAKDSEQQALEDEPRRCSVFS